MSHKNTNIKKFCKSIIAVTMGDPAGVGPEVIAKSLLNIKDRSHFFIIGDSSVLKRIPYCRHLCLNKVDFPKTRLDLSSRLKSKINILDICNIEQNNFSFGKQNARYAKACVDYIDIAIGLAKDGMIDGIVTGPVSKELIEKSGIKFSGHTEYFAEKTGTNKFAMMFNAGRLNITLVTRHVAIKNVPDKITKDGIIQAVILTYKTLRYFFGIKKPRIAVCGLNPHASDGGLFGNEEKKVIKPALAFFKKRIKNIYGPFAADTLFIDAFNNKFDAVIAMYHDQALIPVKLLAQDSAVNITLGLPFIRTSPAHGTAFDIASRFIAKANSMSAAMKVALFMAQKNIVHKR